jgi:hypothetical protein
MFLALISSRHNRECPAHQHVTINDGPVDFDLPLRCPTQKPEPAREMKVKSDAREQTYRETDQGKPSHKLS